jgi:glyoxylase-like metal-dependent hydrolase (beta-lactamase superfamily II)
VARDADLPLEGELRVGDASLRVIDAPGHTFDHAAFYLPHDGGLFTGDVILGEGTSVIAPPGGAMRPYQRTLQRLAYEFGDARAIYGGHGPVVADPRAKIEEYIEHRKMREAQIVDALREGPATIPDLVKRIYGAHRQVLWPAMARQVLAHLIALEDEGAVVSRTLRRTMTGDETAILNPRIEEILGPDEAAVAIAELGTELRLESLADYSLSDRSQ